MDRLIYKEADGDLTCRSRDFDKVFPTLYAYEETGLTPEQAKGLNANLEAMTALALDLSDKLEKAMNDWSFCKHAEKAWKEGRLIILDAPMVPVMEDPDPLSSDVFCPRCSENLSGAFGDEERILLQCPKCGQYIDGTKSMSQAEAKEWLQQEVE